ncbi:MAG: hypothetical protein ACPG47_07885 [Leucothrix sp.]
MQRRQFLGLISLFAAPFELLAANRKPTPEDVEGPFYPVVPIPERSNLVRVNDKLAGQAIELSGRVLDRQGKPLVGTKIEIWQCDGRGVYQHPLQDNHESFDANFDGFGAQIANEQGYYQFTTLSPVPYTGRPPHIHIKLWKDNAPLLTTQLYLAGNTGGSWFSAQRERLQISPKAQPNGLLKAEFTFVV